MSEKQADEPLKASVRRRTPMPGQAVRGSQSGRPIMAALDLLSRRWVLRILWELRSGPRGFREMQALCDQMSPNTLSTRLAELKQAGIVAHTPEGDWALTPLGHKLSPAIMALDDWSKSWERTLKEGNKTD